MGLFLVCCFSHWKCSCSIEMTIDSTYTSLCFYCQQGIGSMVFYLQFLKCIIKRTVSSLTGDHLCFTFSLFSNSHCSTWIVTNAWTCHLRRTRWSPLWETAVAAAPSSGCSVTWPWASDPSPQHYLLLLTWPTIHTLTRWLLTHNLCFLL